MSSEYSEQSRTKTAQSNHSSKVVVVGIYGLPGSGKTFLLNQLKDELRAEPFSMYDGSEVLAKNCPGGLETFKSLPESGKAYWRRAAICSVHNDCARHNKTAVVAGHFMFWAEEQDTGQPVHTQADLEIYTHIVYLDTPVEVISQRCQDDNMKVRPLTSLAHLRKWQQAEKTQLRSQCRDHGILFMALSEHTTSFDRLQKLLRDFRVHNEGYNTLTAQCMLDKIISNHTEIETILVLDADKTLAEEDTGLLFWKALAKVELEAVPDPLKALFGSSLGYSYTAFRQATLLYEEVAACHMSI